MLFLKKILLASAIPVFPALCLCFCCTQKPAPTNASATVTPNGLPYDLQNPTLTINLVSEDLQEISGISPTDEPGKYLAIADERGEIFFVDGNGGGAISRRVLFREKGDFEGVEMVGDILWAVKSDGKVFEVSDWKNTPPKVAEYDTPLHKSDDVEGLGYDAGRHALLLACKGDPDSGYLRNIYAFNLKTKELDPKPLYAIDPNEVNKLVPYGETEKHDYFSPSGVAIHPKTGEVYVISAALKRLVVLNKETGKIISANRLEKKLLPQPEGIAFDRDGNLHLSSEGKKGEGLLLKFNYIKK
jgi:uncharacterized protein YjiK